MAGESQKKTYKSPKSKLVRFFEKSRNSWKMKCREAKKTVKRLKNRIHFLEESKEKWKNRARRLEAEIEKIDEQKQSLEEEVDMLKKKRNVQKL